MHLQTVILHGVYSVSCSCKYLHLALNFWTLDTSHHIREKINRPTFNFNDYI